MQSAVIMDKNNYDAIWGEEIKPALSGLEDERQKAWKQKMWMGIAGGGLMITAILVEVIASSWPFYLFLFVFIGSAIPIYYYQNSYSEKFKKQVFEAVAKTAQFNWQINPRNNQEENLIADSGNQGQLASDEQIGTAQLAESGLYPDYSRVHIDDVLVARSNGKVIPAWETGVVEGRGDNARNIFDGFFLRLPINHSFAGETYIRTRADDGTDFGEDEWFNMGGHLQEVQLEWNEFDKFLLVKSNKPTEAREILTPDFMQTLYDWWHDQHRHYRFAFHGQFIYIAFPTLEDLEPQIIGSIDDQKDDIKEIFSFIAFIEEIVSLMQQMDKVD